MRRPGMTAVLAAAAIATVALSGAVHPAPASADAPVKYGWWSETNLGVGVSPSSSQAPSDGMYVQNVVSGPVAIAAVTFDVPPGAAVGRITLQLAGKPSVSAPPVACPITAAGLGYKPAEGGPWSAAPGYDCAKVQVTGSVPSGGNTATFDAGPLLADGVVAAVILAGGAEDQIAFSKPAGGALSVVPSGSAGGSTDAAAGVPDPSSAPVATGATVSGPAPAGSAAVAPSGVDPGTVTVAPSLAPSTGAAPAPGSGPAAGTVAVTGPGAVPTAGPGDGSGRYVPPAGRASPAAAHRPVVGTAWKAVALIGLIGLLVAWTGGYGLLGARIGGAPGRAGGATPGSRRQLQPAAGGASSEA